MIFRIFLFVSTMAVSMVGNASLIYNYSTTDLGAVLPGSNTRGGEILTLDTTFNQSNGDFSWTYTTNTDGHNGFWLVLTDGVNPKYQVSEYAILYGDLESSFVSAFEYNGLNSPNSYKNNQWLGRFENSITTSADSNGVTTVSVAFNATGINNAFNTPIWDGVAFDSAIGLWFHPNVNASFSYDSSDQLTGYRPGRAGYYDTSFLTTTQIPEPSALLLLSIGAVAGVLSRRRKLPKLKMS